MLYYIIVRVYTISITHIHIHNKNGGGKYERAYSYE